MKSTLSILLAAVLLTACKNNKTDYDASGSFEATETIVSAEATGIIRELNITEGQVLQQGQVIGYIDSTQLYLKKKQLAAQIKATGSRVPDIASQTAVYRQQAAVTQSRLDYLLHEQARIEKLVKGDAATAKQLDDINAQVDETRKQLQVISHQREAQSSVLQTQTSGLRSDALPLQWQIAQIDDQLSKCRLVNEVNGTVLTKYAEAQEMATVAKPLYKIADLSTIILRAYLTGNQLATIKSGQQVTVLADDGHGGYRPYKGTVDWISNKAEFTPKTIQTQDERANLVYAVKVSVKNDGYLKIGMYGGIKW